MLDGLSRFNPMITEAFGGDGDPALNLNIIVTLPPRNPYQPGDQPAYLDSSGPDCQGLDDIDGDHRGDRAGRVLLPDPARGRRGLRGQPLTGNPSCLGGRGPDDVPEGAGDPNPGGRRRRPRCPAG